MDALFLCDKKHNINFQIMLFLCGFKFCSFDSFFDAFCFSLAAASKF